MVSTRTLRCWIALGVLCAAAPMAAQEAPRAVKTPAAGTLRITSPLGRTGLSTTIRLVAQMRGRSSGAAPVHVRFLVDGAPVGTATEGPSFSVPWLDENPFEPREIVAEAEDATGLLARDVVQLPPFEISDRTEVTSVLLEAGVYDAAGRAVPMLAPSAFTVREDGADQHIDQVSTETLPTTVVLLVDNSHSLHRNIDVIKGAALRFARTLRPRDRVIVAPFNAHVGPITGPTDDAETIAAAIGAMRATGGTAIIDAIAESVRLLRGEDGRRIVILVTDAFDENSTQDAASVLADAEAERVTLYAVGIGGVGGVSPRAEETLRPATERTGGRLWFSAGGPDLGKVAEAIAADSHTRYLISYTPTNQKKDGAWRAIAVGVPDGLRVRTREGYRAQAPPPIRPVLELTVRGAVEGGDITADDLEVIEDGTAQTVDTFHEAVDPVSIVLAMDESGSMKKAADAVRDAARQFVMTARPEDKLALVAFADTAREVRPLDASRDSTVEAIGRYAPSGGTALYDALWLSLDSLKAIPGRHAVIVLTDGRDENNPGTAPGSQHTFEEVLALGRQVGAPVFAVGLGSNVDRSVITQLAQESGGEAYFPLTASELGDPFRQIVDSLRRRYVIGYRSTNTVANGAWRRVEIRSRAPGLTVSAPSGYFAPEP